MAISDEELSMIEKLVDFSRVLVGGKSKGGFVTNNVVCTFPNRLEPRTLCEFKEYTEQRRGRNLKEWFDRILVNPPVRGSNISSTIKKDERGEGRILLWSNIGRKFACVRREDDKRNLVLVCLKTTAS